MEEIKFIDIDGISVGHAGDIEGATGCSVVICKNGATAGVDVRGGAPGTRETDLLDPMNLVDKIHAVVLSGGSAFGLEASNGVMQYLEEQDVGFDVTVAKVPIVCSAVLFDLVIGNPKVRPDKIMGYKACLDSEKNNTDVQGNIGAGTGATVGKILGPKHSMKGGLGSYAIKVGDLQVGALIAVNCLGDVVSPENGKIIAGAIDENLNFLNTENIMISQYSEKKNLFSGNTTIGVVVSNAKLTKAQANKVASMAHNGYGRTMRPAHSMVDGDTIFTMATGTVDADINVVGLLAARAVEKAVINAVTHAESQYGLVAWKDLPLK